MAIVVLTGLTYLIVFRPVLRHLHWKLSGESPAEFIKGRIAPDYRDPGFQVGVETEKGAIFQEAIELLPGQRYRPTFTTTNIKPSDVDSVEYWLDGVPIDAAQWRILQVDRKKPIKITAQGRSELIDATFRRHCFIMPRSDLPQTEPTTVNAEHD